MYDKAIGIYEAIDLDKLTPDNQADLLLHLGSAYANTGQNDKAEPCFTAIIEVGGRFKMPLCTATHIVITPRKNMPKPKMNL